MSGGLVDDNKSLHTHLRWLTDSRASTKHQNRSAWEPAQDTPPLAKRCAKTAQQPKPNAIADKSNAPGAPLVACDAYIPSQAQQALSQQVSLPNQIVTPIQDILPDQQPLIADVKFLSSAARLDPPDFSHLNLSCPINADDVQTRWLNAFVPSPGHQPKQYPTTITLFISRVLKSYTASASRGRSIPPFIHPLQLQPQVRSPLISPLPTCFRLLHTCERRDTAGEKALSNVLLHEMETLYRKRNTYDRMSMLAAFQSFLLYAMTLFFRLEHGSGGNMREAMMNLQHLASMSCRHGLVCSKEKRPTWESWIVAEAKRRTLFTMYLFDSVLSSLDGLPTFLGTELRGLPGPAAKMLWEANGREAWEAAYSVHVAGWPAGVLRVDELWPVEGVNEEIREQRDRVDRWLEEVDEYGMMMYAVTSCTHGT